MLRFVSPHCRSTRLGSWLLLLAALFPTGTALAQQAAAPSVGDEARRPKLTKPPKLVTFVEAPYPESEKAAGKQASVILQIAISATGNVDQVAIVQSAGAAFDQAAIAAVQQFKFDPAEIDNKPAPIRIQYRYEFVLKEEAPTTGILEGVVKARGTGEPHCGYEEKFATNPAYLQMYRTGHAYHPAHPFFMWYWGEAGRQHLGRVIVVGADNEYIPKLLGWETAKSMTEALMMASDTAPRTPEILLLYVPPIVMADLTV